jgi:hypothetical protein
MSSTLVWPFKAPGEVLDYGLNWKKRLQEGEFIVSSRWECSTGIVVVNSGLVEDYSMITVVWLSGGILSRNYICKNIIGTNKGRLMEYSAILPIKAR